MSAPTRVELGTRTIFNLLGPLVEPGRRAAPAGRRLRAANGCGRWPRCSGRLGAERAWVVHGDGIDELTTTGATMVAEFEDGKVATFEVTPEDVGLPSARRSTTSRAASRRTMPRLMRELLGGADGPLRDIVLLNSAAALIVAGQGDDARRRRRARRPVDRHRAQARRGAGRAGRTHQRTGCRRLPMSDVLAEICADKRADVARARPRSEPALLERGVAEAPPVRAVRGGARAPSRRRPLRPDRRDQEGLAQRRA